MHVLAGARQGVLISREALTSKNVCQQQHDISKGAVKIKDGEVLVIKPHMLYGGAGKRWY